MTMETKAAVYLSRLLLFVGAFIPIFASSSTLKIRSLPGRSDTFEHIRQKKKIYVDKCKYICKLLDMDEKFYFISRPHRFGKSNFLQTLRAFFVGNESLFRGLNVPADHDWGAYSVIYFNFARANIDSAKTFLIDLGGTVIRTGKSYGIKVKERRHFEFQLRELVLDLSEGRPESVVVLVDDYDRPVRRNLERGRRHAAKELNDCLEDFFELLLGLVESLKMVMVTGVTNIQLMEFSSVVANFRDITNDPQFDAVMGFTPAELKNNFEAHVCLVADEYRTNFKNITDAIRRQYDSYCFWSEERARAVPVLNPSSVLSCLEFKKIDNYWYKTAPKMPDYIVRFFRENRLSTKYFHDIKVLKKTLQRKYDFEREIPIEVYLILHGYLTYRDYDAQNELFVLSFPSKEVEETFRAQMLADVDDAAGVAAAAASPVTTMTSGVAAAAAAAARACGGGGGGGIKAALVAGNTDEFINEVDDMLAKKMPPITQAITEEHPLTSLIESILRASAVDVESGSVLTATSRENNSTTQPLGDIDIETLNLPTNYVLEFKWRKTAAVALNQLLRYANSTVFQTKFKGKTINLVGMNFSLDRHAPIQRDTKGRTRPPVRLKDWIKVRYHDGVCSQLEASHSRYLRLFNNLTLPGTNCNAMRNFNDCRSFYYKFI